MGPHIKVYPGPRPRSVPSGILIHPVVWPQYTNVTDREDRQRAGSMGRNVTCDARPKCHLDKFWSDLKILYYYKADLHAIEKCSIEVFCILQYCSILCTNKVV